MRPSIRSASGLSIAFGLMASLPGCVSDRVRTDQHAKKPNYDCVEEAQTPIGKVSVTRTLNSEGRQLVTTAKWDAGDGNFANPWITAFWVAPGTSEIDFNRGTIDIMWHLHRVEKGRPFSQRLRLELQSEDAGSNDFGPTLKGGQLETSGGPFHFDSHWADVTTLARSAPRLVLVARDGNDDVKYKVSIDPAIFNGVLERVRESLRVSFATSKDFSHQCKAERDDIIVT